MIPNGWKKTSLGAYATINPPLRVDLLGDDKVLFLPMTGIDTEGKLQQRIYKPYSQVRFGYTAFCKNDILVAKITPCFENGKGVYVDFLDSTGVGFGSTEFHVIRCDASSLLPRFGYYITLMDRFRRSGARSMSGSAGQKRVPADFIRSFPILLPPLPEQRAIVEVLSTWDRAIELTAQLIEAKKKLKHGLMQQLLTGKRRFRGFEGQEWRRYRIGDILKEENRWVDWDDNIRYHLVSVRRWNGGLFSRGEVSASEIKVKKLKTIRAGDFVISHIQGAYGAMALVPDDFDGTKVSDLYSVLVPRAEVSFDIRFFSYLSQTGRMRRQIYAACNGFFAERLRLNFSPHDFLTQMVRVPTSPAEQRRIADVLDTITNEINLLQRRLEALRSQKKGLMQKLLTGQVRVKVEPRHMQPTEEEQSR